MAVVCGVRVTQKEAARGPIVSTTLQNQKHAKGRYLGQLQENLPSLRSSFRSAQGISYTLDTLGVDLIGEDRSTLEHLAPPLVGVTRKYIVEIFKRIVLPQKPPEDPYYSTP